MLSGRTRTEFLCVAAAHRHADRVDLKLISGSLRWRRLSLPAAGARPRSRPARRAAGVGLRMGSQAVSGKRDHRYRQRL